MHYYCSSLFFFLSPSCDARTVAYTHCCCSWPLAPRFTHTDARPRTRHTKKRERERERARVFPFHHTQRSGTQRARCTYSTHDDSICTEATFRFCISHAALPSVGRVRERERERELQETVRLYGITFARHEHSGLCYMKRN